MSPRILSLLPSTTEIAAALGLEAQLVGRSHECTVPERVQQLPIVTAPKLDPNAPSAIIDARVKQLVRDGLSVYRVDADRVRALRPDVILTQTQCEVCAVTPRDLEEALCDWAGDADGARPRLVACEPETLGDVFDDFVRVAEACGVRERGEALRAHERARLEAIAGQCRRATSGATRPRVALLEWIDPPMGPGSWIPELIEHAGGEPLLGRSGEAAAWTSLGELGQLDPDVLVVAPCGFDLARTRAELGPLVTAPAWPELRAVREGRVALVDGFLHVSRPGPRLLETLEIFAEILHPSVTFGWRHRAWEPL